MNFSKHLITNTSRVVQINKYQSFILPSKLIIRLDRIIQRLKELTKGINRNPKRPKRRCFDLQDAIDILYYIINVR